MPVDTTRPRRTQDERSTAMRERLLDATVDCLVQFGYAGTTVTRIAERAGVTRGAQVHHFRTKDDLVTAAVTHLAGRSARFGLGQLTRLAGDEDPVGSLLDLFWELHQDATFVATVELWVAARTDAELREAVGGVEPGLLAGLRADAVDPLLIDGVYTAMDAMRGLVISAWHLPPRQRAARWRRARESLRRLFPDAAQVREALGQVAAALSAPADPSPRG